MTEQPCDEPNAAQPPPAGTLRWCDPVIWAPTCLLLGAAMAWAACESQEYFAPWLIFPLMAGILTGILLVGAARTLGVGARSAIVLGTLLAATVVIVGQHYRSFATQQANVDQEMALFQKAMDLYPDLLEGDPPPPTESLLSYMSAQASGGRPMFGSVVARGGWAWATWVLDGVLLTAGALLIVLPALRRPYCSRCHSWYQTTRRNVLEVESARRVATLVGVELPDEFAAAGCRVVSCRGGCGPIGFELWQEEPRAKRTVTHRWLDRDTAYQIPRAIDEEEL